MLESTKCKIPCNGKTETELNIRLNNHQKDVWKPDATPEGLHFSGKSYNFNTHAKFILIGQIFHIDIDKKNKERIKKTLTSKGINQELN